MARHGQKLTKEQQTFIVFKLAEYMPPSEVIEAVAKEYKGLRVTPSQVQHYDPTTVQGQGCAQVWRDMFWAHRRGHLADVEAVKESHLKRRLELLVEQYKELEQEKAALRALGRYNPATIVAIIAQQTTIVVEIEKFMGKLYTNRRLLEVQDHRSALASLLGVDPSELPDTPES